MDARDWPLIGRDDESRLLLDLLRTSGASIVVSGQAGIGKTRLVRDVLGALESEGKTIRRTIATSSASSIPFGALMPLLGREAAIPDDRGAIVRRIIAELTQTSDTIVAVDDAHLLDDLSAAVVHQLAWGSQVPLVLTMRTGEPAPSALTDIVKDGYTRRLELQPLSWAETKLLVESALDGTVATHSLAHLWEVSAGNPMFLRELVLGGLDSGTLHREKGLWRWTGGAATSPVLRDVVTSRLVALSDEEQRALEVLAIGEPLRLEWFSQLCSEATVAALERKQLVTERTSEGRTEVRLAHPIYGEVLRAGIAPRDAETARSSLVDLYERLPEPDPDDVLRAALWHFDAGRRDRPDILLAGAHAALRIGDAKLVERLGAAVHANDPSVASALVMTEALIGQGRYEESVLVAEPFLVEQPWSMDQCVLGEAAGRALWVGLDRADDAIALYDRGIDGMDDPALLDRLVALRDSIVANVRDSEPVIASSLAALDRGMLDPIGHGMHLTMAVSLLTASGRIAEAIERFDRHFPELIGTSGGGGAAVLLGARGLAVGYHGSPKEVVDFLTAVHDDAVRSADNAFRVGAAEGLSTGWLISGRPRSACRYGAEFMDLTEATGRMGRADWVAASYTEALALLGDADGAERMHARATSLRSRSPRYHHPEIDRAGAWVHAARGELSAARDMALRAAALAAGRGWRLFEMTALLDVVRFGGAEHAAELMDVASRVQGDLAHAVKLFAEATVRNDGAIFDTASEAFESTGRTIQAAESSARAAALHEEQGHRASAASAASRSRLLAEDCEGAITPILASGQKPDPLTRREREVATLAAQGLSNRAIADRLTTSVRTVEGHLYQAYAKLGVSARAELAAAIRS